MDWVERHHILCETTRQFPNDVAAIIKSLPDTYPFPLLIPDLLDFKMTRLTREQLITYIQEAYPA